MTVSTSTAARIVVIISTAIRVGCGILWIREGTTKYRAGFGGADIRLVVDSTAGNSRVPGLYKSLIAEILGASPGFFGFAIPLLETGLGICLALGIFTLPAACVSIATLMIYWLADQLAGQYPIMVLLSTVIVIAPIAATRFSITHLLRDWLRHKRPPPAQYSSQNSGSSAPDRSTGP